MIPEQYMLIYKQRLNGHIWNGKPVLKAHYLANKMTRADIEEDARIANRIAREVMAA